VRCPPQAKRDHISDAQRAGHDRWRGEVFPIYFEQFLHPYLSSLAESTPAGQDHFDARIDKLYQDFAVIAAQMGFMRDLEATPVRGTAGPAPLRAAAGASRAHGAAGRASSVIAATGAASSEQLDVEAKANAVPRRITRAATDLVRASLSPRAPLIPPRR